MHFFKDIFLTLPALLTPPTFVGVRIFPLLLEEEDDQCVAAKELVRAAGYGFCGDPAMTDVQAKSE